MKTSLFLRLRSTPWCKLCFHYPNICWLTLKAWEAPQITTFCHIGSIYVLKVASTCSMGLRSQQRLFYTSRALMQLILFPMKHGKLTLILLRTLFHSWNVDFFLFSSLCELVLAQREREKQKQATLCNCNKDISLSSSIFPTLHSNSTRKYLML